jgi:two-component system response regulator MprA
MRILVVEDEEKLADLIRRGLERSAFRAEVVHTGEEALERLSRESFDGVVLDLMLPGISGLDVVRNLRSQGIEIPVIALTARGDLEDRVLGLEAGCDDYLPKPFAFAELVARLRALMRRSAAPRLSHLTYADLTLDPQTRVAHRGGRKIELTNREYVLLEYLVRRPEQVLSRAEILESVWGYDFETPSNVLEVYVNFLRKKLEGKQESRLLHTVRGVGYVLRAGEGP